MHGRFVSFHRTLFFVGSFCFLFINSQALIGQIQQSAGDVGQKPFTATVALREGFDSNPLTTSYQSNQKIQSSSYTQVQPSLGYNYLGTQADLFLRYDFGATYYPGINYTADVFYAQTLVGKYTYQFDPRTSITLGDNFVYTEQPIPDLVNDGITPILFNSIINNLATVEGNYRVTDRLSMVTRWNNTLVALGGGSSSGNYMNNGAFQQFRLDFTPETVGTFSMDYQLYDYDYDFAFRDNQQASFSIGADHTFLPNLFFSGRAGIQLNDNFGLADNDQVIGAYGIGSGNINIQAYPFFSLSSTWNYEQRSFASAGFSMQVQQSDLANVSDSVAYTINLNWDHYFTDKFSVIQSFFLNLATFDPSLSPEQTNNLYPGSFYQGNGKQTTVSYQCKFAYEFYPYLSAELGWSYTSYGSYFDFNPPSGNSYTRNQVYLGLRGTY